MLPRFATCRPSSGSLKVHITTCLIDDRVDSGPRDLRYLDKIRRLPRVHVTCKKVRRVGHSPTRKKWRDTARLNRGVDSPINVVTVPSIGTYTWRPTRAPTWPRGLPATWPRTVRLQCGPPGRCHVASVPRRNPSWSCVSRHPGPCATSAAATSPCR